MTKDSGWLTEGPRWRTIGDLATFSAVSAATNPGTFTLFEERGMSVQNTVAAGILALSMDRSAANFVLAVDNVIRWFVIATD